MSKLRFENCRLILNAFRVKRSCLNPFPTVSVKLTDSVVFTHIIFARFGITLRNVDIFYICIHHYIPDGAGFKAILFLTQLLKDTIVLMWLECTMKSVKKTKKIKSARHR